MTDRSLRCWGNIDAIAPGSDHTTVRVLARNVVTASLGTDVLCAILDNTNDVRCWGEVPLYSDGDTSVRSKRGTVLDVAGTGKALAVAANGLGGVCVTTSANLFCLGHAERGATDAPQLPKLIRVPVDGARSISTGYGNDCAINGDGGVACWQWRMLAPFILNSPVLPAKAIAVATSRHDCAVLEDGRLMCWDSNESGQLGIGHPGLPETRPQAAKLTEVVGVALGLSHTCAITADGAVACWGGNSSGEIGDGTTENRAVPIEVRLPARAQQVVTGTAHTCALLTTNEIYCWGDNGAGQLGDGTTETRLTPVRVSRTYL